MKKLTLLFALLVFVGTAQAQTTGPAISLAPTIFVQTSMVAGKIPTWLESNDPEKKSTELHGGGAAKNKTFNLKHLSTGHCMAERELRGHARVVSPAES